MEDIFSSFTTTNRHMSHIVVYHTNTGQSVLVLFVSLRQEYVTTTSVLLGSNGKLLLNVFLKNTPKKCVNLSTDAALPDIRAVSKVVNCTWQSEGC